MVWWGGILGVWTNETSRSDGPQPAIALSGAYGGRTVDFRRLSEQGVTLVGRVRQFTDGAIHFADGLAETLAEGDRSYLSLLDQADAAVEAQGLDLPSEQNARDIAPDSDDILNPPSTINLREAGITSIIWATGFSRDFSWLHAGDFDAEGNPKHSRGISPQVGLYFVGQPWLTRWASAFITGVWYDAKLIADHIAFRRKYIGYQPAP